MVTGIAMAAMIATLALSACFAHVPFHGRVERLVLFRVRVATLRQRWTSPLPVGAVAGSLAVGVVGGVIEGQRLPEVVGGLERFAS